MSLERDEFGKEIKLEKRWVLKRYEIFDGSLSVYDQKPTWVFPIL